jgi:4-diphosphocytidyl-2-C-methyl-D-erythritol kinase
MIVFPHSKINLGLQVISKRTDGFHDLETIFYPIGWSDILEIVPSETITEIQLTGFRLDGNPEQNLCIKAYKLLKKNFDLPPVKIFLHKMVPAGSGLGGGSSDAAFTLKVLNTLFKLEITDDELSNYASVLGSDCAFFIRDSPCLAKGRGEILEPFGISLKDYHILLVVPPVHVSTPDAFAGIRPRVPEVKLRDLISLGVENWRGRLVNDFESTVFRKYPQIQFIKESLFTAGASYVSMSGSGSSVFALFHEKKALPAGLEDCRIFWDLRGNHS